jgi:hypothetical protein
VFNIGHQVWYVFEKQNKFEHTVDYVISFCDDIVVVWSDELKKPLFIPREHIFNDSMTAFNYSEVLNEKRKK